MQKKKTTENLKESKEKRKQQITSKIVSIKSRIFIDKR